MPRPRLIDPTKLTLEPDPPRASGASYDRTRRRVLRAWKRGEADAGLRVLHNGEPVTPEQVNWDRMPSDSGPSGESSRNNSVYLGVEAEAPLDALSRAWGLNKAQTVARALREALEREEKHSAK